MPNNETFGISTELTICDEYNLANSINLERTNKSCVNIVKPVIEKMKSETQINIIEHWGGNNGSIDFKYKEGNETKTLSVKTNKSKSGPKVSPQNIGQPTKKKFLEWFSLPVNSDNIDISINDNNDLDEKFSTDPNINWDNWDLEPQIEIKVDEEIKLTKIFSKINISKISTACKNKKKVKNYDINTLLDNLTI